MCVRIAFWSGPRNVSTALLRAWGNRQDTVPLDEPFYAAFLKLTGIDHPGRDETLARHVTDPQVVIDSLCAPLPAGKRVLFQKQMAHHMVPGIERGWMREMRHGFLIRDPAQMIASYAAVRPDVTVEDLGQPQMFEIFEQVRDQDPPVIDACDLLQDPRGMLTSVCERFGLDFDERMLSWAAGPREWDGVWAKHWYSGVERSTGFRPTRPREVEIPAHLRDLHAECEQYYRRFREVRIRP